MIRLFLIITTLFLLGMIFKEELTIAFLKYMAKYQAEKKIKEIKDQINKQLEPLNQYLGPISSSLSYISGTNIIATPLKFIKYSFGFIIFSFAYSISSIIDGIYNCIYFIGGLFSFQEGNGVSNINNNHTTSFNGSESGL